MRRKPLLLAMPLLLAACGSDPVDSVDEDIVLLDSPDLAGPTGTGSYEVIQDGEIVGTTRIGPDGRYTETYADGSTVTGSVRREGARRICFAPDDGADTLCFSEGDPQADGSFEVVGDDGSTAIIRPAG